ncbi:hypothetical protein GCM10027596_10380 [Nocardioides korecus]
MSADLRVALTGAEGQRLEGHLHGSGSRLTFDVSDPGVLAGRGDAAGIRAVARTLAERGIAVRVVADGVHLVTVGDVTAPWWQRRATGSRRIRVGSVRGAWTSLRSRAGDVPAVLPGPEALPPATMFPLVPTFGPRRRRRTTTTHGHHGTGSPRLALEKDQFWPGEEQDVWWLDREHTTIGSDPTCDVVLPGLAELHATVQHDDSDEYVLQTRDGSARVHGAPVVRQVLRTGSRIELGEHCLSFYREEYADHGRPYAGRAGGEVGRQRPQPPRRSDHGST